MSGAATGNHTHLGRVPLIALEAPCMIASSIIKRSQQCSQLGYPADLRV